MRAGLPRSETIFPGDEWSRQHFGAFADGKLVGVATIHFVPLLDQPDFDPAYQLRGMATVEEMRGQGVGRVLVEACVEAARKGRAIWCNARTLPPFWHTRLMASTSGVFDIPTAGPHVRMRRVL